MHHWLYSGGLSHSVIYSMRSKSAEVSICMMQYWELHWNAITVCLNYRFLQSKVTNLWLIPYLPKYLPLLYFYLYVPVLWLSSNMGANKEKPTYSLAAQQGSGKVIVPIQQPHVKKVTEPHTHMHTRGRACTHSDTHSCLPYLSHILTLAYKEEKKTPVSLDSHIC